MRCRNKSNVIFLTLGQNYSLMKWCHNGADGGMSSLGLFKINPKGKGTAYALRNELSFSARQTNFSIGLPKHLVSLQNSFQFPKLRIFVTKAVCTKMAKLSKV